MPAILFAAEFGAATVMVSDGLPPSLKLSAPLEIWEFIDSTTRPKDMLVGDRSSLEVVGVINLVTQEVAIQSFVPV